MSRRMIQPTVEEFFSFIKNNEGFELTVGQQEFAAVWLGVILNTFFTGQDSQEKQTIFELLQAFLAENGLFIKSLYRNDYSAILSNSKIKSFKELIV